MARNPNVSAIAAIVERLPQHPSTESIRSEAAKLRERAVALDAVHSSRNPLVTPAAHALNVAKLGRTLDKETTAALNRTIADVSSRREGIDRRIADKVNLRPDAFASEIRIAFRALPAAERLPLVSRMIEEKRGPELAAILDAPTLLTGLTAEQSSAFRLQMMSTHAAAELAEMEQLEEALEALFVAADASGAFVRDLTNPGKLQAIERDAAAAEAASADFLNSIADQ